MIIRSSSLRQNPAYRPGNSPLFFFGLLLLAVACRTRVPEQVIVPPRPRPTPVDEAPREWALRPGTLAREYRVEQRALLSATDEFGATVSDSTSVVVEASVRNVPAGGVAGLIRTVTVGAPGTAPISFAGIVVPYAFTAAEPPLTTQASPVGRPAGQDPCASSAHVPLVVVRDILVRAPASLVVGREWTDSGSFVTCRDGVRLDVISRRRFALTRYELRDGAAILHVARTGSSVLRGVSIRGDDTTRVEGSGTNAMQYELDASTGDVISASGTGTLDMLVRGTSKSQRARQTSATLLLLRSP